MSDSVVRIDAACCPAANRAAYSGVVGRGGVCQYLILRACMQYGRNVPMYTIPVK